MFISKCTVFETTLTLIILEPANDGLPLLIRESSSRIVSLQGLEISAADYAVKIP